MKRYLLALIVAMVSGIFADAGCFAQEPAAPAPPANADAVKPHSAERIPDSLMFTIGEVNEIQSRVAGGDDSDDDRHGGRQPIEDATLYLSTILYLGPKDWTIWVNGVPIQPNQDFQAFQVTQIDSDAVELLVPLSAQGMRPVRLRPNQTFVAKTGAVIEGRYP